MFSQDSEPNSNSLGQNEELSDRDSRLQDQLDPGFQTTSSGLPLIPSLALFPSVKFSFGGMKMVCFM